MDRPPVTLEEKAIADAFRRVFYDRGPLLGGDTWARTYWFGARILKCPFDLWLYQDLIGQVRPDMIIECGTGDGGSALYFASLCQLAERGHVFTIDVKAARYQDSHPRITRVLGSSTDPNIVRQARLSAAGSKTLVVLDSDHSYDHVTAELAAYAPLVSVGSYLVIEDTNAPETKRAADDFVAAHPEFEIDAEQEKYLITYNTWLRRRE